MSDLPEHLGSEPDVTLRYADHPDGVLDLHLPVGPAMATVVVVHGGFWRSAYDRVHVRPVAHALREAGMLVATPEYRRTGAPAARGGGWPVTLDDVREAVVALPGLLGRLGLALPSPVVLLGHSAGGHLVLLLAAEAVGGENLADRPGERLGVHGVVALAPVGDLRDADARDLGEGAVRALLGGGPEERPARYAEADPALGLASDPGIPVVVVHGTADLEVPVANSRWASRLPHVDLRVLEGVDHYAIIDPGSSAWPAVLDAVAECRLPGPTAAGARWPARPPRA